MKKSIDLLFFISFCLDLIERKEYVVIRLTMQNIYTGDVNVLTLSLCHRVNIFIRIDVDKRQQDAVHLSSKKQNLCLSNSIYLNFDFFKKRTKNER